MAVGNLSVSGLKRFGWRLPTLFCLQIGHYLHRRRKSARLSRGFATSLTKRGQAFKFSLLRISELISASAGVAQLVRAPPCHGGGRGFESRLSRQSFQILIVRFVLPGVS